MEKHETQLEYIMRIALIKNRIRFADQVYAQTKNGYYMYDFVVYGVYCTIVVECDGIHHILDLRQVKDSIRDLWSITNGFQDVLRFNESQIRHQINDCIRQIIQCIDSYDAVLKRSGRKINPLPIQKPIHDLRRRKKKSIQPKPVNDYFDGNYESIKPYINKPMKIPAPKVMPIERPSHFFDFRPLLEQLRTARLEAEARAVTVSSTNPEIDERIKSKNKIYIDDLPTTDKSYYLTLQTLNSEEKRLMWKIIKRTSRDGVALFGDSNKLQPLILLNLLEVNKMYRSPTKEISLFVLPYAPYLLRTLIRYSKY